MLVKNPILILCYLGVLVYTSWQLTLFTVLVLPLLIWAMSTIGRKLKAKSLAAQNKWSETMAQLEETLGGMRIVKAFTAEQKMRNRFENVTDDYRRLTNKVSIRQASAHPVSEFLGTVLIVIVLWYGGTLILDGENPPIDAPQFIFYMVILYSIIQPLKDFSKASYNIPKGMASVERVNKILNAENTIVEAPVPKEVKKLEKEILFRNVSFSYNGRQQVLQDINLRVGKGRTVALVGQSGSGKSTLVDLLPRYHDVTGGEILIDGINVKDFRLKSLRGLIGNVNQDAILFNDSFFNKYRLRSRERNDGTGGGSRQDCKCSRFHYGERAGLRYQRGRPRLPSVGRSASAHQYSPRNFEKPRHTHPRRGYVRARHRVGASCARGVGALDEDAHHHRYCAPPFNNQKCRRDLCALRRKDCGAWHTRRTHRSERLLQAPQ